MIPMYSIDFFLLPRGVRLFRFLVLLLCIIIPLFLIYRFFGVNLTFYLSIRFKLCCFWNY
jgi:hypothetical protein